MNSARLKTLVKFPPRDLNLNSCLLPHKNFGEYRTKGTLWSYNSIFETGGFEH